MYIIAALVLAFMITGCNATEISERDFVAAAGIDRTEDGKYKLTVIEAFSKEGEADTVKISFGESLEEAMDFESELTPFYGQMKTVIFGQGLLNDEKMLKATLNSLLGDNSVNMKTIVLGCSAQASGVIQKMSEKSGLYVWKYYKNNDKKTALTYKMTLNAIAKNENRGYVLPLIYLDDDLKISGGAVMDGHKFLSALNEKEMETAVLLKGDIKEALINTDCGTVKIKNVKRKVDFNRGDKNALCGIKIYMNASTLEEGLDLGEAEEYFERSSETVLKKVYNECKTDALSFYEQMCKHKPLLQGEDIEFSVNFFINGE